LLLLEYTLKYPEVLEQMTQFVSNATSIPGEEHLTRYVTSHPGQLSLAIPSWVGAMSNSQRAVMPCGWGVKAGMVRV